MWLVDIAWVLLLAASAVVSGLCVVYAFRVLRGRNRRRMLTPLFGALSGGAGDVGLSIICLEAESAGQVARLLAVEYENCEVVVVVDSAGRGELLAELVERYSMVGVDYRPADSPQSLSVRRLYRSCRRRFRRLTLIDAVELVPGVTADAAVDVATYDYVTILRGAAGLRPYAVERIVAEIAASTEVLHEIVTAAGGEVRVCLRDDVVSGGGFVSGRRHFCRRRDRRCIYEKLTVGCGRRRGARLVAAVAATAVAVVLSLVGRTLLPMAVVAATMAVVAAVAVLDSRC